MQTTPPTRPTQKRRRPSRSRPRSRPPQPTRRAQPERLQKLLSRAGIASRRKAEELIQAGRVRVNGTLVTQLGTKAIPGTDRITIDGRLLPVADEPIYILLHKPVGV